MTPAEFNALHLKRREEGVPDFAKGVIRNLTTKDGLHLSVQASAGHSCLPRENQLPAYTHFEVATYKQDPVEGWGDPIWECPGTRIYGLVPVEDLCDFINEHGGLKASPRA